jgi:Tol biopolymer transport system component
MYAEPGYLLFASGDRLVAQRFDRTSLRPVGKVVPLGDAPPLSTFEGAYPLTASANGVLAHIATSIPDTELVWLDRAGRQISAISLSPGSYTNPTLSSDGRRAIVSKPNSPTSSDLWMVDLERAVATRLTFDGRVASGAGTGGPAIWSLDEHWVAVMYSHSGRYDVYRVPVSGAGRPEPLVQSNAVFKVPLAWSPDGRYLVFSQNDEPTVWDLWLLPLAGDRKPVPYLRTPFNEMAAAISPDGRWLAYDSDETGVPEIYVRSFPEPGEKHRVSTAGGTGAQWSRDGRELLIFTSSQLFYGGGPIFSVAVETTPTFKAGAPRLLFTAGQNFMGITATSDLKRFLAAIPVEGAAPPSITIILNWQAALKH